MSRQVASLGSRYCGVSRLRAWRTRTRLVGSMENPWIAASMKVYQIGGGIGNVGGMGWCIICSRDKLCGAGVPPAIPGQSRRDACTTNEPHSKPIHHPVLYGHDDA